MSIDLREQIARVIDPTPFEIPPRNPKIAKAQQERAFAKADAIDALRTKEPSRG